MIEELSNLILYQQNYVHYNNVYSLVIVQKLIINPKRFNDFFGINKYLTAYRLKETSNIHK